MNICNYSYHYEKFSNSRPHPFLATDNLVLPASTNYLDSRLKFSSVQETKQFKSAKRRIKDMGFESIIFLFSRSFLNWITVPESKKIFIYGALS